jgi:pimeloyl-ACP methyl ester carboxylesterase
LLTKDGVSLAAWYAPAQNEAAILLIHGATGSRENIKAYATFLAENGYGVLAFDLRGHGESGGDGVNAYGWDGTKDVGAAVEYLKQRENVKRIGGLGISLGAEILLGASSTYKDMEAIVSDGASHRSLKDYLLIPSKNKIMRSFTTRLMYISAELSGGVEPPLTMAEAISQAYSTKFLFVAAGGVEKEKEYNNKFSEITNGRSEVWVADGAMHTKAFHDYPDGYKSRILDFYNKSLLNKQD